jgi:hypothetical protein
MKNPFSIDKSYKIRHKILEVLHNDWENHNYEENRSVGSIKVATDTNIPIAEIHQCQYLMIERGEITFTNNDGQSMMTIQQAGITAFIAKKYIKEGMKERWDRIYDWARIIIPLAALLLSIFNLSSSIKSDSKIQVLETKVEQLKK